MAKSKKLPARARSSSVKLKRRTAASKQRGKAASRALGRYVLPIVFSAIALGALGFFALSGYQTATSSQFFTLRNIEITGNERTSTEDIRRIVAASVEKPGVWNADLAEIRARIEKFPFVKAAAVSRVLPAGVRVNVTERVPAAVVHLSSGDFLIDADATVLAAVKADEKDFPFVLRGWDEAKTEKAVPDNLARLKLYRKMLDEWRQFDLAGRVKEVNLSNPREPVAVVEDSGREIAVGLARDNLGMSLKSALDAVTGKGLRVKSVDAGGVSPIIQYLEF